MGVLHKLMPARDAHQNVKMIVDLDDLIVQKIGFKYLGKMYVIEPMTTYNFMLATKSLQDLQNTLQSRTDQAFQEDEIYVVYHQFISTLCPAITLSEIRQGTIAQLHGLLNLMIRHISGQTNSEMEMSPEDKEKKKIQNLKIDSQASVFSRFLHSCLVSLNLVSKK